MMKARPTLGALSMAAALALASAAAAHPMPKKADPAPNASLSASPAEIRIAFSEGLEPAFSGIELKDQAGKAVPLGPSSVDSKDKTVLAAPLKTRLGAGTYTVQWHVVGDDTHHVAGHYTFQVK